MINMSKSFLIVFLLFISTLLFINCGEQIAGGTEVGNPAIVMGTVHDNNGKIISKANVYLVTPHFNAITDSTFYILSNSTDNRIEQRSTSKREMCFLGYADNNGQFILSGLAKDTYNLLIMDSTQEKAFFKTGISIYKDSIDFGIVTLNRLSYATITIGDSTFKDSGYISMPGTPIKSRIAKSGVYTIPILSDSLNYIYFDEKGDSLSTIIKTKLDSGSIRRKGDTLDLTGTEHILIPPRLAVLSNIDTSFTPGEILVNADQVLNIIAVGAYSNKGHVLEYQFFETNNNVLSNWSTSNIDSIKVKDSAYYSISCRVRSQSDHSKMTDWTPAFPIHTIIRPQISTPTVPVIIDTLKLDSVFYRLLVSNSFSTDSKPVYYRLYCTDLVQSFYSDWSENDTLTIHLKQGNLYAIQAQARHSVDTTIVSSWSDTLFINLK